jgi:hypothetical protein
MMITPDTQHHKCKSIFFLKLLIGLDKHLSETRYFALLHLVSLQAYDQIDIGIETTTRPMLQFVKKHCFSMEDT